jgi:MerR family transcriptional regulator, light-induced transcriptional regulator
MKNFPIRELEFISGVKAHTLRVWEHRYGLLQPERTECNNRLYCLKEVEKLLHIAILHKNGYRISKLSKLSIFETENKIVQLKDDDSNQELVVAHLFYAMHSMDIESFESILERSLSKWNASSVVNNIIYPFLVKTKLLWEGNGLSEEHIVVTILRKKLMWAIENITVPKNEKSIILFLFGTRLLDLAMLHTHFLLKASGMHVINLGNDVSVSNLISVSQKVNPLYFYTYHQKKNNIQLKELNNWILNNIPGTKIILSSPDNAASNVLNENIIEIGNKNILTVFPDHCTL